VSAALQLEEAPGQEAGACEQSHRRGHSQDKGRLVIEDGQGRSQAQKGRVLPKAQLMTRSTTLTWDLAHSPVQVGIGRF